MTRTVQFQRVRIFFGAMVKLCRIFFHCIFLGEDGNNRVFLLGGRRSHKQHPSFTTLLLFWRLYLPFCNAFLFANLKTTAILSLYMKRKGGKLHYILNFLKKLLQKLMLYHILETKKSSKEFQNCDGKKTSGI